MNLFGTNQLLPIVLLGSIILEFVIAQQKDYYKILGEWLEK